MNLDKLFLFGAKFLTKYTNFMVGSADRLDTIIKENPKLFRVLGTIDKKLNKIRINF